MVYDLRLTSAQACRLHPVSCSMSQRVRLNVRIVFAASLLADFSSSACALKAWDAMVIHTFGIRIDDRFGKLSPDTPFVVISSPNVDFIPYIDDSPNGICHILRDG